MELLPSIQEISLNPPSKKYRIPLSERLTTMKLDFSYNLARFWPTRKLTDASQFELHEYVLKPTLDRLHIDPIYYGPVHTGQAESSAVTDLRFIDWDPKRVGFFKSVPPSCTNLKRYVLETNRDSPHRVSHPLGPQDYGLLLGPHSASLEELIIAYSDGSYNDGEGCSREASSTMGTLINYTHLKRLALPEAFLVTLHDSSFRKLLPPQLEELQIQYPMGVNCSVPDKQGDNSTKPGYRLMRMQRLAKCKETLVPRLKHVAWWFQQTSEQVSLSNPPPYRRDNGRRNDLNNNATRLCDDPRKGPIYGPPEDMDELVETFGRVGVKFEWCSMPKFDDTPFARYLRTS